MTSWVSRDGRRARLLTTSDQVLRTPSIAIRLIHSLWVIASVSRRQYPLHAAAISLHGKVIVLLGAPGSGKTVTALLACRSLGGLVVASDLVVVRQMAEGATLVDRGERTLRLRRNAIALLDLPDLKPPEQAEKAAVRPGDVGIGVLEPPLTINHLVFIRVDAAMHGSDVVLGQESHLLRARLRDALWYTARLASGTVRLGAATVELPLAGADRDSLRNSNAFADALVDSGRVSLISGSAESVVEYLGGLR